MLLKAGRFNRRGDQITGLFVGEQEKPTEETPRVQPLVLGPESDLLLHGREDRSERRGVHCVPSKIPCLLYRARQTPLPAIPRGGLSLRSMLKGKTT